MWCKSCRQEVPGIASALDKPLRCARCGAPLGIERGAATVARPSSAGLYLPDPLTLPPPGAPWELEEHLHEVDRILGSLPDLEAPARQLRFDAPQPLAASSPVRQEVRVEPREEPDAPRGPVTGWWILAVGLAASMCGAGLAGWGFLFERPELSRVGFPSLVIGQLVVSAGLVLLLDLIWEDNRRALAKVAELESRLGVSKNRADAPRREPAR